MRLHRRRTATKQSWAPNILSLMNAATAQVQARSLVTSEATCMASLAYCRNRPASPTTAS
jgi:hypothetical protein